MENVMSNITHGYVAELRSIDAWRGGEGGWEWNDSYVLEDEVVFCGEAALTPRSILSFLRRIGYLSSNSKGRVRVVNEWPLIEIQNHNTGEPLLALLFNER